MKDEVFKAFIFIVSRNFEEQMQEIPFDSYSRGQATRPPPEYGVSIENPIR
jgi:hypothetical protein